MTNTFCEIAGRFPLLSTAQEIELGRRIQRWLQDPAPDRRIIRDGQRAREQFVNCNLRLVVAVAKRYARRLEMSSLSFDDILQECVIGLQRAAEKYDPECGYKMSTYAYWWIRQAISRALESKSSIIRVTLNAKRKLQRYQEAERLGGTPAEILQRAGLNARDLKMIRNAALCDHVVELDALDLQDVI
jgi:RNA polymerase sigma factor (sigma-70 family)